MADAFDAQPPHELRTFYDRFAARFRRPGVHLAGYRLRWIAFRTEDLDRGVERAVLDLAWGEEDVTRQAQFVTRAREAAGEPCCLTFVQVGLKRAMRCDEAVPPAPAVTVLSISMWRSDHPCGLLGRIDLDAQVRPTGTTRNPLPLLRMGG
jgi:hypothetical protein